MPRTFVARPQAQKTMPLATATTLAMTMSTTRQREDAAGTAR
ncbi:hypothetical protein Q0F99_18725 [Rathayibacter oskolensis]|nr:hypothetical protein [Rathayibacter oskolensis]WKK71401.1 hypothetical protein Q0F99_18725 [Rathayibacter oskolensis]